MNKMVGLLSLAALQTFALGASIYGVHDSCVGLGGTVDQIHEEAVRIGNERQAKKAAKAAKK